MPHRPAIKRFIDLGAEDEQGSRRSGRRDSAGPGQPFRLRGRGPHPGQLVQDRDGLRHGRNSVQRPSLPAQRIRHKPDADPLPGVCDDEGSDHRQERFERFRAPFSLLEFAQLRILIRAPGGGTNPRTSR